MGITDSIASTISRLGASWRKGFQADGKRDLYGVYGWHQTPDHRHFLAKYFRQDIAKRVVEQPVFALWSDPPMVTGDPAFQEGWQNLLAVNPVFFALQKLDILAGLGRYAVMVVGFDDGADLKVPITNTPGRKVIYMQPYAEGSVEIVDYEQNPANKRFGLPVMYKISPGRFEDTLKSATLAKGTTTFECHYSRVLHAAEGALESPVFGRSRLEPVYNVLDDIMKVAGGSAETFWLNANRGLHIDVDKDTELDKDDADALSDEVEEYANELRRVIRTRGVKVNVLGSDVADPRGVFDVLLSLLASATGIPKRLLAGSEAGQLASQQDRANWAQRMDERITNYGAPIILIPFIRMMIDTGVLPVPSMMQIEWPDAFKMNPLERAQTSAQMARSAANLSKMMQTIDNMNIAWATASTDQEVPVGGGGLFGNADPKAPKSKATTTPTNSPSDKGAADPKAAEPQTMIKPAIVKPREPIVMLTVEECRSIIGFGKHQPVFDGKEDAVPAAIGKGDNNAADAEE